MAHGAQVPPSDHLHLSTQFVLLITSTSPWSLDPSQSYTPRIHKGQSTVTHSNGNEGTCRQDAVATLNLWPWILNPSSPISQIITYVRINRFHLKNRAMHACGAITGMANRRCSDSWYCGRGNMYGIDKQKMWFCPQRQRPSWQDVWCCPERTSGARTGFNFFYRLMWHVTHLVANRLTTFLSAISNALMAWYEYKSRGTKLRPPSDYCEKCLG